MMKYLTYYLLGLLVLCFSCKKAEDRSCFKFEGEEDYLKITLPGDLDSLNLYDNLEFVLVPDTINYLSLTGGENLLNHIEVIIGDGSIEVRNENKCNFLRSYKNKIIAEIHIKSLRFIHYEGSEKLFTTDTLKSSELRLMIRDGAGPVDLTLENGYTSAVITHGWGDFTLRGKTAGAYLNCNTNSFCNTLDLEISDFLVVHSGTVGDMHVNADKVNFEAEISARGNIFYTGTPLSIELEKTGEGHLIDMEE